MDNLARACDFIDDVPWERHPAFLAAREETAAYLRAFSASLDRIPVRGTRISFHNDVWDFRPYYDGVNDGTYRFAFTGLPEEIKMHCKFFLLRSLENSKKPPTPIGRLMGFKSVVSAVLRKSTCSSFHLITVDDVVNEVESRNRKANSDASLYFTFYLVYRFLIRDCGMALPIDADRFRRLSAEKEAHARDLREASKTPNIPDDYLNAIISAAVRVMRDGHADHNRRATACLLLIETQIALRPCDLVNLRTHQLLTSTGTVGGRPSRYIRYVSRKASRIGKPPAVFNVRSNLLSTEAFETLLEIRQGCALANGNDFLYVLEPSGSSTDDLPVSPSRYRTEYHRFLAEELPEMSSRSWEGASWSDVRASDPRTGRRQTVRVCSPVGAQFRVRLCTVLHERGYPQKWIDENMGHLSGAMQGYYARPKDTFQENVKYTERFIADIAGDGTRLLGGQFGDEVKAFIEQFIEEGGFDVKEGVSEIVKALGDKVVVRAKTGGACVKTSLVPCGKDARTNELLCAYGLCPNLFHFYHSIDVTFASFAVLQETYATALDAGREREAQKELNKLKDLCQRRLIPELDELDREIERQGADEVIVKHPDLYDIIMDRTAIRKEAQTWLKK